MNVLRLMGQHGLLGHGRGHAVNTAQRAQRQTASSATVKAASARSMQRWCCPSSQVMLRTPRPPSQKLARRGPPAGSQACTRQGSRFAIERGSHGDLQQGW